VEEAKQLQIIPMKNMSQNAKLLFCVPHRGDAEYHYPNTLEFWEDSSIDLSTDLEPD